MVIKRDMKKPYSFLFSFKLQLWTVGSYRGKILLLPSSQCLNLILTEYHNMNSIFT